MTKVEHLLENINTFDIDELEQLIVKIKEEIQIRKDYEGDNKID